MLYEASTRTNGTWLKNCADLWITTTQSTPPLHVCVCHRKSTVTACNATNPELQVLSLETKLVAEPMFDLLILGTGTDGHTASLFPYAPQLASGLSTVSNCLLVDPPHAPHQRISMTLTRLLKADQIILPITGER